MVRNILVLSDGTEVSSGAEFRNAVQSLSWRRCVNDGSELALGSVCVDELEARLITPGNALSIAAGERIELYREEAGLRRKWGVFLAREPQRPTGNSLRLLAYSPLTLLEKDMTGALAAWEGWPYTLGDFAELVCASAGLTLKSRDFPNASLPVEKFTWEGVTGSQLMAWVGQAAGCFVRCDADGLVELGWYTDTGKTVDGSDCLSLSLSDYDTAPIDGVGLALGAGTYAYTGEGCRNPYRIWDNPILSRLTEQTHAASAAVARQLARLGAYRPCRLTLPWDGTLGPGDVVTVHTRQGSSFRACVMECLVSGQRMELVCVGSPDRSGIQCPNTAARNYAQQAVRSQSQEDIFNRLTNGGTVQGIYLEDGQIYINASYLKSGTIAADLIKAGILQSADGKTFRLDLDNGTFTMEGSGRFLSADAQTCIEVLGNELVLYSKDGEGQFIEKVHIGFTRGMNPAGTGLIDYPYIIFGSSETASVGLIKKFYDGIFFGNSVLKDAVGEFAGAEGVAGFFVSTVENKAYVVAGTEMQNVYTGEAVARFA